MQKKLAGLLNALLPQGYKQWEWQPNMTVTVTVIHLNVGTFSLNMLIFSVSLDAR